MAHRAARSDAPRSATDLPFRPVSFLQWSAGVNTPDAVTAPFISDFTPDPALYPFRSRWMDATAGRVHFLDEGEGPPLLFLHGNPTWSFVWRGVITRLRRRFRCIAVDFPGFGLSEHPAGYGYTPREHADVVSELIDHLGLDGITVVGHDWGGPIGMRAALDNVSRIRALVMSNTWYWPAENWRIRTLSRVLGSKSIQRLIVNRNLFVERIMPHGVKHRMDVGTREHYRRSLPTAESRRGVAVLPAQIIDASFWLGEIAHAVPHVLRDVPVLLPWGVHDLSFSPRTIERFKRDFRNVTVVRLDGRHFVQEDAPEEMARAIGAFLMPETAAAA
jgi:haloalkane dehalogenase